MNNSFTDGFLGQLITIIFEKNYNFKKTEKALTVLFLEMYFMRKVNTLFIKLKKTVERKKAISTAPIKNIVIYLKPSFWSTKFCPKQGSLKFSESYLNNHNLRKYKQSGCVRVLAHSTIYGVVGKRFHGAFSRVLWRTGCWIAESKATPNATYQGSLLTREWRTRKPWRSPRNSPPSLWLFCYLRSFIDAPTTSPRGVRNDGISTPGVVDDDPRVRFFLLFNVRGCLILRFFYLPSFSWCVRFHYTRCVRRRNRVLVRSVCDIFSLWAIKVVLTFWD